jgi:dTDP-4-dehydrorhamnose 3,5-epimerase-like enzyme
MKHVKKCQIVQAASFADARGGLAVFDPLPFTPVRAFVIYDIEPGRSRAHHAHRTCTEALIATSGAVDVFISDGQTEARYLLNDPSVMLVIPPHHWIELSWFSDDASLTVLADHPYDGSDHINDFAAFVSLVAA